GLEERFIGIPEEQLRKVPLRVGIGGGEGKQQAVLAPLGSGLLRVLITDVRSAELALEALEGRTAAPPATPDVHRQDGGRPRPHFTHSTVCRCATGSTRSDWYFITACRSLYADGLSSSTPASSRVSMPFVSCARSATVKAFRAALRLI